MEFDNILPENVAELEPKDKIFVRRELVLGYDFKSGAPIKKIMGIGAFTSVKNALEFVSSSIDSRHAVIIPLPGVSLSGFISKDESTGISYLSISSDKRSGIVPVAVGGVYAATSDGLTVLNIGIAQNPDLFESGLSVVELSKDGEVSLEFIVNPGKHTVPELADGVTEMMKKTNSVINNLLDGI